MTEKPSKLEKKLKELQEQHMWQTVYLMSEAFGHTIGSTERLDWTKVAQASYHAGAAKVIQDALINGDGNRG